MKKSANKVGFFHAVSFSPTTASFDGKIFQLLRGQTNEIQLRFTKD